jgi:thioredoxin 1
MDHRSIDVNITFLLWPAVFALVTPGATAQEKGTASRHSEPIITFVELGSTTCTPCRRMQPVIKSVEDRYGDQIKVIFYDVWKEEHRSEVIKFKIRLIPTQVFLDKTGKEVLRHEGYFPESAIDEFLQTRGLVPRPVVED